MASFFITGTDTDVGKTWFTCWLIRSWRKEGFNAAALKPIATGDRDDARLIEKSSDRSLTLDEINPVYFKRPAAPLIAAEAENRSIDLPALNQSIAAMGTRFSRLAVEGVGGWRVPIAPGYEVRDWARDLGLPVVVVALNRLGVINHTLLTVESILSSGLTCAGIVLNAGPVKVAEKTAEKATEKKVTDRKTLPDLNLARRDHVLLLESLLRLPVFEFDGRAQATGSVPTWLGGK